MARKTSGAGTLNHAEWAGYLRFMREELAGFSPDAAAHLRRAEETVLREGAARISVGHLHADREPGLRH